MKNVTLKAQKRDKTEKLNLLRSEKVVPCVVYGNSKESCPIKVNNSDLIKAYKKAGTSSIISLDVEWDKLEVLMHDFQNEPVNWDFLHVDFYEITRWQAVTTEIRLNFIWNSEAVREWAILEEYIKELEVTLMPRDLVESIDVDISPLKEFGDAIRVKDLKLDPEKYELSNDLEDVIAIASEPRKEDEIEDTAPEAEEVPVVWEEWEWEESKEEEK